jgi:hypothetical protein
MGIFNEMGNAFEWFMLEYLLFCLYFYLKNLRTFNITVREIERQLQSRRNACK